jgi:hypothetical protein
LLNQGQNNIVGHKALTTVHDDHAARRKKKKNDTKDSWVHVKVTIKCGIELLEEERQKKNEGIVALLGFDPRSPGL